MVQIWDDRYGQGEYAYGEKPNEFFKAQLSLLKPGKILLPAEGEGRNAVFAARLGWEVTAFDQSMEGKKKAIQLAEKHGVTIDYLVGEFSALSFEEETFDALGLVYAHFPAEVKSTYQRKLAQFLKKGGAIIFEAFSKNHLPYVTQNPKVGGPKDIHMLFSVEELKADFSGFDTLLLAEAEVELQEGIYHQGLGSVIRFVGRRA